MLVENRVLAVAGFFFVIALLLYVPVAAAHAVLLEATPAANASVKAPDVTFRLRYNVRIEAGRSRLSLLLPDKSVKPLATVEQPSPDTLSTNAAGLAPGSYVLRWQVLASDGHITRGEVPFTVVP
ncbi:MAG: copper resistance CopC family protein [Candidatus Acidiferrum sp.]